MISKREIWYNGTIWRNKMTVDVSWYADAFFAPLKNGFCTFYEEDSGERTVFIEFLNTANLDLKKLETIIRLHLPGNQISDITIVSLLKNLEYLGLKDNRVTDIAPLKELKKLFYLDLRNNPVNDPDTLDELKKRLGENLII